MYNVHIGVSKHPETLMSSIYWFSPNQLYFTTIFLGTHCFWKHKLSKDRQTPKLNPLETLPELMSSNSLNGFGQKVQKAKNDGLAMASSKIGEHHKYICNIKLD